MSKDKQTSKPVTAVAITLRSKSRPGVVSVGAYQPDRIYTVAVREAARLTSAKGFEFVTPGDAAACAEAIAALDAPATTTNQEG